MERLFAQLHVQEAPPATPYNDEGTEDWQRQGLAAPPFPGFATPLKSAARGAAAASAARSRGSGTPMAAAVEQGGAGEDVELLREAMSAKSPVTLRLPTRAPAGALASAADNSTFPSPASPVDTSAADRVVGTIAVPSPAQYKQLVRQHQDADLPWSWQDAVSAQVYELLATERARIAALEDELAASRRETRSRERENENELRDPAEALRVQVQELKSMLTSAQHAARKSALQVGALEAECRVLRAERQSLVAERDQFRRRAERLLETQSRWGPSVVSTTPGTSRGGAVVVSTPSVSVPTLESLHPKWHRHAVLPRTEPR